MHNFKIKIDNRILEYYIFYSLMFLMFLLPPAISENSSYYLTSLIKIISYAMLILNFFITRKAFNYSFLLIIAYNLVLVISTIVNNGQISESIKHALVILLVCYTLTTILKDELKREVFVFVVRDITLVFFIVNIAFFFIFPKGIPSITRDPKFPNFLYMNVNSTIKYVLPGMCCSSIIDIKRNKKISKFTAIFLFGIFYQAIMIYFTATAVIACIFIILWIFFIVNRKLFNSKQIYATMIAIILLVEILISFNSPIISIISRALGKDGNLSGRTVLWSNIIKLVYDKLLFGYGALSDLDLVKIIGNFYGAHNYFLDILFQRGLLGLLILILIITYPIYNYNYKNKNKVVDILMGYSLACLLISLSEPLYTKEHLIIAVFYSLIYTLDQYNIYNRKFGRKLHYLDY